MYTYIYISIYTDPNLIQGYLTFKKMQPPKTLP